MDWGPASSQAKSCESRAPLTPRDAEIRREGEVSAETAGGVQSELTVIPVTFTAGAMRELLVPGGRQGQGKGKAVSPG